MKIIARLILVLAVNASLVAQPAPVPGKPPPLPVQIPQDTLFSVQFTTGPNWDARKQPHEQQFFKEHGANLARLRREGSLVIGARYGEFGLIVLRLPDEAAVQSELEKDPSVANGTFAARIDAFRPFMHGSTHPPLATSEAVALRAYYDAYNRHDPEATAAFLAENVKWFGVAGDTQSLDGDGREAVKNWLTGYFNKLPTVKAEVLELRQTGPHLFVHERAAWRGANQKDIRQSAFGIYEIRDGLIQRVWYYPSVRETPPSSPRG
jgi:hypothetical protein